jgi:hypothetical protein
VTVRPGEGDLLAEASMDSVAKVSNGVAVVKETNELVVTFENGRCIAFDNGESSRGRDATVTSQKYLDTPHFYTFPNLHPPSSNRSFSLSLYGRNLNVHVI